MEIVNSKARHEYTILQEYTCGIVLYGAEVKSIRAGKCNIGDSYCYINNGEVWLKNCHISKYDSDIFTGFDELRERKLLLNKREIRKINSELQVQGITLVPLKIFVNKTGLLKINIGLCKGKKLYDKKEALKEKDNKRELEKVLKGEL